jgi:UDP:flavonoid glycosyltransferase YjiC (YdhE family)
MSRILLAWELGAASGHLAGLRPLVEGLLARGHQVTLASIFRLFRLPVPMNFMADFRIRH